MAGHDLTGLWQQAGTRQFPAPCAFTDSLRLRERGSRRLPWGLRGVLKWQPQAGLGNRRVGRQRLALPGGSKADPLVQPVSSAVVIGHPQDHLAGSAVDRPAHGLVDQGTADSFLERELTPERLEAAVTPSPRLRLSTAADRDPTGVALAQGLAMLRQTGHADDALGLGVGHWRPREHDVDAGRQLIEASIEAVVRTFVEVIILVVVVVFVFLQNWRATLIPVIALARPRTGRPATATAPAATTAHAA